MKRKLILTAGFLWVLAAAIQSNAEMKIMPSGIITPDNSAALHLSGIFATRGSVPAPYGAVISGVNSYSDNYYSCGGYFCASGAIGVGVHGEASHTGAVQNYGGYFTASGKYGDGVFGSCLGTNCAGVRGEALYSGNTMNYGGIFKAFGTSGIAVSAVSPGTYGKGVDVLAYGTDGTGVYAAASGTNGTGVYGYGGQYGFYGHGGQYDFYAANAGYGSFTGAHDVKFARDMSIEVVPGLIVSVTGKAETRKDRNGNISLSSTLPTVTLTTKVMDKAVFGVLVSQHPLPEGHWYEAQEGESFGVVNALGEGRVWVTDINGQIHAGDYITTSVIPGYGQMQDDDLLHSYTLGKAIETAVWDQVMDTVQHDGKVYKRYLMAVVYTSG